MIVLIDNYDSFTYNLYQALVVNCPDIKVFRNDETTVAAIEELKPDGIVISPGPCTPEKAGISVAAIKRFSGRIPLLGVCLGHQSIGVAFGATVSRARAIMHGKVSMVMHDKSDLYRGMKNPFQAGRYHSLAVLRETLPAELVVDATSEDREIMGMRHTSHPTFGVQFHPESVLTPTGKRLLKNFLNIVDSFHGRGSTADAGGPEE